MNQQHLWRFVGGIALLYCIVWPATKTVTASTQSDRASESVRAYVTNFAGDGISVIDPAAGRLIAHIKTGSKPHGVAIAPDGDAVYVSNEGSGTVSIIDPATNVVVATIDVGKGPNQLAVSADGRHLFVTLHEEDALAVVDVAKRRVVERVPVGRS
ncbi:MAG: beta-propeller fold lactonase family protein, partial [Planctomycetes bacterium]|nr:beta-propeller fold lactonase family protein [Planctomycetota bacterium]